MNFKINGPNPEDLRVFPEGEQVVMTVGKMTYTFSEEEAVMMSAAFENAYESLRMRRAEDPGKTKTKRSRS